MFAELDVRRELPRNVARTDYTPCNWFHSPTRYELHLPMTSPYQARNQQDLELLSYSSTSSKIHGPPLVPFVFILMKYGTSLLSQKVFLRIPSLTTFQVW